MTTLSKDEREKIKLSFIEQAGWQSATRHVLDGDASTRAYTRLTMGHEKAILMDAPLDAEAATCPVGATPEERAMLGYNAEARLAGPNLMAFVALSQGLRQAGLRAPEILHHDVAAGFALMEDLGDGLYTRIIQGGGDESKLYQAALAALVRIHGEIVAPENINHYTVQNYDTIALMAEINLFADWYWPFSTGATMPTEARSTWQQAWHSVLATLSKPHALVLRDYHAENLLWLPESQGLAKVGIIDFQDALFGHRAYDVVSLLEDARRDVAPDRAAELYDYYKAGAQTNLPTFDARQFDQDYAVLAAQRNAKILGIFARLVNRDGKKRYLDFMPRVQAHFKKDLNRTALEPVKDWVKVNMPEIVA